MKRRNQTRDDLIRSIYHKGLGGILGRRWGISRQRVWQIIHNYDEKPQNGQQGGLIRKVMVFISKVIKGA